MGATLQRCPRPSSAGTGPPGSAPHRQARGTRGWLHGRLAPSCSSSRAVLGLAGFLAEARSLSCKVTSGFPGAAPCQGHRLAGPQPPAAWRSQALSHPCSQSQRLPHLPCTQQGPQAPETHGAGDPEQSSEFPSPVSHGSRAARTQALAFLLRDAAAVGMQHAAVSTEHPEALCIQAELRSGEKGEARLVLLDSEEDRLDATPPAHACQAGARQVWDASGHWLHSGQGLMTSHPTSPPGSHGYQDPPFQATALPQLLGPAESPFCPAQSPGGFNSLAWPSIPHSATASSSALGCITCLCAPTRCSPALHPRGLRVMEPKAHSTARSAPMPPQQAGCQPAQGDPVFVQSLLIPAQPWQPAPTWGSAPWPVLEAPPSSCPLEGTQPSRSSAQYGPGRPGRRAVLRPGMLRALQLPEAW